MEPSLPTSEDPVLSSRRMEPSLPTAGDPVLSSPLDPIKSIREWYKQIDPVEQIGPLVSFIDNQLQRMNTQSEAGSSSQEGWLATVREGTYHAKATINTISTEAEKLSESVMEDAVKEIGRVTLQILEGVGDRHWVFIGLSVAAFAVERYISVSSKESRCSELLMRILELGKDVKQYDEQIPEERGKLCNAVGTIMEGAVLCCDNLERGNFCRFWSAATALAQLEKAEQQLRDVRTSLGLSVDLRIPVLESSLPVFEFQRRQYEGGDKDVFLCHSGKQKDFVRELHRDLTREHVSCFFDEDENSLPLAEKFPDLIFKAVETCKIAVLVLSEDFIYSKWPMLELCKFIKPRESGKNASLKLLPVFFMITPEKLSHITKNSQKWKELLEVNGATDDWQAAIKEVRPTNGLVKSSQNEVDFKNKVVKAICDLLKQINPPPAVQLLDFKPVGIEKQVGEVKALLDMEGVQSALAVDVCGFGGVGKTTIAASVVQSFDWSSINFKFCRVAFDETKPDKTSHIVQLQKDIISDLGGVKLDLRDSQEGRHRIKEAVNNRRSFLFIDNVVDKDYIKDLLPKDLWSGELNTKLRILITSREKNVKPELEISCKEYEVNALCEAASEDLLFKTIMPGEVVKDISLEEKRMIKEVAAACRGVPLLLSIFGKHLRAARDEHNYRKWLYEEALVYLTNGNLDSYREEDLGKTLMFVYHKIKDVEVQDTFLDICTYFHGWEWSVVADIVDFTKLEDLRRRMLVSRSGSDKVIVHDILRLMGMNEASLTRFSDYRRLLDGLNDDLEGFDEKKVKGISLVNDNYLITIHSSQLEAMRHSLRVLMLGDWVTLEGLPCQKAFRNLRYLRVGDITAFPFKDLSKLDKLRVFHNRSKPGINFSHLPSSLKRITHEVPDVECDKFGNLPFKNLSSLESFIVKTKRPVDLPKELHLPQSLVDLELNRCMNLPKDIGHLTALESLILDGSDLQCLPHGFGNLKKLKRLSMDDCSKLGSLSQDFGMLSSLEELSMRNCENLRALPESFGGLLSLQKLKLDECINMKVLPESFGELRLQSLDLYSLDNLNELPNSFGNMPLLKYLNIKVCHFLKSLPKSFVQLKMLETLEIYLCTKLSVLPEGFGQFEKLRFLSLGSLRQLKTLSDDFENMATLERLEIRDCPELEGAMMEKILKLQNCYKAGIEGSTKLVEKWEHMKGKSEHPILVSQGYLIREEKERAMRVALLHGKCVEVNDSSGQLMERSSLLEGLEEGITATVALIMIPIPMQSHQHQTLHLFVKRARERAESNGSGKLQIVCAGKVELKAERGTAREEEEIHQILVSLPKGSCAIPSSQSKRLKILTFCCDEYFFYDHKLSCYMANVGLDNQRRNCFENLEFTGEYEISANVNKPPSDISGQYEILTNVNKPPSDISEKENFKSIKRFIESLLDGQSQCQYVAGKGKTEEFVELLKGNGIDYLLTHNNNNTSKMVVDDLNGKTIGFIICDFEFVEYMLQQICKDLQKKDPNFIAIWIPSEWPEDCGLGSCTRLIECMPLATFPYPQLVSCYGIDRGFVVLDKDGKIVNHDALPLLMGWGVKFYPFTQHTIPEPQSFSMMGSKSFLEFLLHGMNIVGRTKMTFLYADDPAKWHKRKPKLEELRKILGSFEVLYVGQPSYYMCHHDEDCLEILKQEYEDAIQDICWPSLSFSEMMMFWYRCWYMEKSKEWFMVELCRCDTSLVLVDNNGIVTYCGYDVLQMICEWYVSEGEGMRMVKNELMKSLSRGECTPILKTFLGDKIHKHPLHSQHPIKCYTGGFQCDVCYVAISADINGSADGWSGLGWDGEWWSGRRSYRCDECEWFMCGSCWRENAKQQLHRTKKWKRNKREQPQGSGGRVAGLLSLPAEASKKRHVSQQDL